MKEEVSAATTICGQSHNSKRIQIFESSLFRAVKCVIFQPFTT